MFVSYTRRDGRAFAQALTLKLVQDHDLVVFLDDHELDAGERLGSLLRAARRSRMLVVVATPRIGESAYVPQEVEAARRGKRRILPIDVGRTLEQGRGGAALAALLQDEVWSSEPDGLAAGPTDLTVRAIARSGRGLRRRNQLRILVSAVIATLSALVLYAFYLSGERQRALELETVRADEARRLAFASRLLLARELSAREPSRARLLLEDGTACPSDLRDVAWALVHGDSDRGLWESPADWEPQAHVGFLDDGRLACVSAQGATRLVDLEQGTVLAAAPAEADATVLGIDCGARTLALRRADETVLVRGFDGGSRGVLAPAAAHRDVQMEFVWGTDVVSAAFLERGRILATLSKTAVRFWDLAGGVELPERRFDVPRTGNGPADALVAAVANPAEAAELLVAVTTDWEDGNYAAGLFRLAQDGSWSELVANRSGVTTALAASRGGLALASTSSSGEVGSGGGYLQVLIDDGRELAQGDSVLNPGRWSLACLALAGSGKRLAVGLRDGTVRILEASGGRVAVEWAQAFGKLEALALDEGGARLALLGAEGGVRVLRTSRPEPRRTGGSKAGAGSRVHVLARAGEQHLVHGWSGAELDSASGLDVLDAATGALLGGSLGWLHSTLGQVVTRDSDEGDHGLRGLHEEAGRSPFAATPDGEWLAAAGYVELDLVHLPTLAGGDDARAPEHPPGGRLEAALCVAFTGSPPRQAFVRLSQEARDATEYWEEEFLDHAGPWVLELGPADGSGEVRELWRGPGHPQDLAFSPDGRWLAFADGAGPVRTWDGVSGEGGAQARGPRRAVRLAFSPDSEELAVLTEDDAHDVTLEILRLAGGRTQRAGLGFRGARVVRFPQPGRVVAGGSDGAIAVFDRSRSLVHLAKGPEGSMVIALEASPSAGTLLVSRLLVDGGTRCTLADGAFGHELFELTLAEASLRGAALLAGGRGVLLLGPDRGFYAWTTARR